MIRTLPPSLLNSGALILSLLLFYTGLMSGDKITWLMEVTPVIIVAPLLLVTARRYPLTPLLYTLIFFHAIIFDGWRDVYLRQSAHRFLRSRSGWS
ncbi:Inner membrane protein yjdF [Salmonella enterica subsp. arizonae]|uniref:Inner membrane protein yjdF n=1 Tax=Salmonella enterica subsp. arizonae TaxID=59203 RepID=A0A379TIU1_SALER|nr:Inner membrane protein yjdF [Salmonella enterica subsp. arizonae]